jgi:predicted methyltransferase
MIVLSHFQTRPLLVARQQHLTSAPISPDLGLTTGEARLTAEGIVLPTGERLGWGDVVHISETENQCFLLDQDTIRSIQVFSPVTHWSRSLFATASAPTTLVAGFPMHRVQQTDPIQDTRAKLAAIAPIKGQVLDTATGLGYTAIEAAKTADCVTTIELDPAALEIARMNPWSQALFDNPRIIQYIGDAAEVVERFADQTFMRIIHDPPTLSLAGELYSQVFYSQLYRVLSPRGKLFHYIGDLSGGSGQRVAAGVMRRLQEVGFRRVVRHPEAFGVVAFKQHA